MLKGISHITLSVSDVQRSFDFYVNILGCEPVALWGEGAYVLAGDQWIALILDDATRQGALPEYTHTAFRVADGEFEKVAARVVASGATIFQENKTEGASIYFLDPDGHKLELHQGDLETRLKEFNQKPWSGLRIFDRFKDGHESARTSDL